MSVEADFKLHRGEFVLDVQLTLPARGISVVFGPSGSGKTLLLRCMAGLEHSETGTCRLGEIPWQDDTRFVPPHARAVGYVFQEASLFPHLNVEQNLCYGMRRVPPAERRLDFDEVVELLGVRSLLARRTQNLSGGERQRVAIARALLTSPRLLLMDEPLAALDEASKQDILPYFDRLHHELEIPVIYVTHDSDEVARLADYLVLLENGRVRAAGEASEILTRIDLPLSRSQGAQAIVAARVAGHDEQARLSYLDFGDGRFAVAQRSLPVGEPVRLRVLARDVSLTLERQSGTSILNIFAARVEEMAESARGQVTVCLSLGKHRVLARITYQSAQQLNLAPGAEVFVQIKSAAVLL